MRLHPMWGLILFFLAALATTSLAYGGDLPGGTPDGYERREIEGFTVYVNKQVLKQPFDRWGRQPLSVLERELNDPESFLFCKKCRSGRSGMSMTRSTRGPLPGITAGRLKAWSSSVATPVRPTASRY